MGILGFLVVLLVIFKLDDIHDEVKAAAWRDRQNRK